MDSCDHSDSELSTNGGADNNHSHQVSKKPKLSLPNPTPTTPITPAQIVQEFAHHDSTIARINNGSFGCCPSFVLAAQRRWQLRCLSQPDLFFHRLLRPAIETSRRSLLPLINAPRLDQISLVDNVTTATAIVLQHVSRSFHESRFKRGDAAIILHYAFGAVKKSVQTYVSRSGGHVIEVQLPFPVYSDEEIIAEFKKSLTRAKSENRRVRLVVIDHITSMPCVIIPVKELVKICREEGVDKVFVDGAHAIGCTRIDLNDIGADFYTSNLHKWLFCPPSVAFLYCKNTQEFDDDVHHPVVSNEYGNGLPVESAWIGTRDYTSQLVVPDALEFINRFEGGIDGIMKRNHEKVVVKGNMLAQAWGTHIGCSPSMCASMIMVGLPACLRIESEMDTLKLRDHFRDNFGVEVPIYYRPPKEGEMEPLSGYARISCQVYNTDADYDRFRDAVNQLVRDGFKCADLAV